MSAERQIQVPASVIAIYTIEGQKRTHVSRRWLEDRHDLCEDLAQLLAEKVKDKVWQLGITPDDGLERIERGLSTTELNLSEAETAWVVARTREVLSFS